MRIRNSKFSVWFTGRKPLSELPGFRPRYRPTEFACLASNRGHRLEDRLTFAYWAMTCSSNKDGVCKDVPLNLKAPALEAKWGSSTHPRAQRARDWLMDNGFIVRSDNGAYYIGKRSQMFYVNHAKIKAWVAYLRQIGKLPKGKAWMRKFDDRIVTERAVKKVERLSKRAKTISEMKELADKAVMGERLHISLATKYGMTHEEWISYITYSAIRNTPIYRAVRDYSQEYNIALRARTVRVTTTIPSTGTNPQLGNQTNHEDTADHLLSVYKAKNGHSESNSQEMAKNKPLKTCENYEEVYKLMRTICRPHVHVASNAVVTMISFRAYSGTALLSSHNKRNRGKFEGSDRQVALDRLLGAGNYCEVDRSCSISHLNKCLHMGRYYRLGDEDIYGEIHYKGAFCELLPWERSEFKKTVNRVYFTNSARLYSCQVSRAEGTMKEAFRRYTLEEEYINLRYAYEFYCGKPIGVPIFFYESLLMVLVQIYLLRNYGLRSANVYDALYIENGEGRYSEDDLKDMMEEASEAVFPEVLKYYKEPEMSEIGQATIGVA